MRFSLSLVVAATAAAGTASASFDAKAPRDLHASRMIRRSPSEKTSQLKNEVDVKCYGPTCSTGTSISSFYQKQFAVYSQFTQVQSFSGCGCFPNLVEVGGGFSQVKSVESATAGFAVLANSLMAFGEYIKAQTTIAIRSVVVSFQNLCQTLSVFIVQIQSIVSIGGEVVTYYSQTILAIQGFLTRCFSQFGQQVFFQAVGAQWSTFTSLFIQVIQFGQTRGFLSDPSTLISQGVNLMFFEQQCHIAVSTVVNVKIFTTTTTSCATFCVDGGSQPQGHPYGDDALASTGSPSLGNSMTSSPYGGGSSSQYGNSNPFGRRHLTSA